MKWNNLLFRDLLFSKLRPWQPAPVESLLDTLLSPVRAAVDLSDMGTGKTYVACAVAKALQVPTLVVCPWISQSMWKRVAAHFNDTVSVVNYESLRTGRTPFGQWQHQPTERKIEYYCVTCQNRFTELFPCPYHPQGIHCVETKTAEHNYGKFLFAPQVKLTIFDEVHRCGGRDSLNADMLIGAKQQGKYILGLSATAATGPLQMRALGYALGLHTLVPSGGLGYYEWLHRNGCGKLPGVPGYRWTVGEDKQNEVMLRLNNAIIPRLGVRVRTTDIPNFPTRTIIAEEYDIEHSDQIDAIYAEMAEALAELEAESATDVAPESPLTKILRARQKLELLKVPLALELNRDYLDKGFSVAIFCNFSATIDALARRLGTDCIIDGRPEHKKHRDVMVNCFQSNRERNILVNNEAGGVSIGFEDRTGDFPRAGLVFPCDNAVTLRQVFGRLPRDGGKSHSVYRVLFAANTVESSMARRLRAKSNNLDTLNDGDLQPDNFKLLKK